MELSPDIILLGCILFFAVISQALSGFGSVVITVTLGALYYDIEEMKVILIPLNIIITGWIVFKHHKVIDKPLLFKWILPIMGAGVVLGIFLADFITGNLLVQVFGGIIVFLAITELVRNLLKKGEAYTAWIRLIPMPVWLLGSGITHGLYGSGGPMLVYAVGRLQLSKSVFRNTLSAVWLIFNTALTVYFIFDAKIHSGNLPVIGAFVPVVIVGFIIGDWLHHRVPEKIFRIIVFALLGFAGAALLLK